MGLVARPEKCGVYLPNAAAAALGVNHCEEGLCTAGTLTGSDAFVAAHAQERADAACAVIE